MYARRLVPVGIGAALRARQELEERLEKEGLFSPALKRPLPMYPSRVALITSETGAAAWDVIQVARRRYPSCALVVVGTQVQGFEAPGEIVRAISRVPAIPNVDCVLLVRGGGSREDLIAFDDERVVRAVRSCPVPVVSGVGHDVDRTLCDRAADLCASTPSAAAELVFPDRLEIDAGLFAIRRRMKKAVQTEIQKSRTWLGHSLSVAVSRMNRRVAAAVASLETLEKDLRSSMALKIAEGREALGIRMGSLDALSPLAVMARGFVACERDGKRVVSASGLSNGDKVLIHFPDGRVEASVNRISKREPSGP